ncbi:hypothetical protein [Maliponia aquimaris]|uniref:Uncharacterized protein n=1 Tax=Maliponia aquimaris TaxID=1673631 RepID=A0A238KZX1_9RHOB|nr:hypothetical protein [Maliponia aquimaris]SMX48111.1 hypothetical protein MAA8898_03863 [Maliponia aquimaris]
MGLKKLAAKLADYRARLEGGKASEIKPDHVRKVLEKLRRKQADLEAKMEKADGDEDRERLTRKLEVAQQQIRHAEWLLENIP